MRRFITFFRDRKIVDRYSRFFILSTVGLFITFGASAAEDDVIEEIIVTGSYIKRTTADSPSPLSVVSREDMDAIGVVEIKDVIATMTYQSGNIGQSNVYNGGDSSTGNTNINLRNLGMGSTLVLVNSKRSGPANNDLNGNGYVDLSNLVPAIALERVEVVKDGSSALYGSDAVAGVVN
ncbi:MAG: TonB-dependent receptor plug domain-containing protein, partial [Gammaproteobacteria bacterium]|nr:TonB-dependent receptor plug domain-containing protein [Gammaproteobacteria bacterium]